MKYLLIIAIVVSAVIALYEAYFGDAGLSIISLIVVFYGYVLLKCCCCCKPTKRKR